jgi:hypothetical protein
LADQTYLIEGKGADEADRYSQNWGLAVADFDADGHLDFYRSFGSGGFLYLGTGDGDFSLADDGQIPEHSENQHFRGNGAITADMDGDGSMDLLVSRAGRTELLLNDGSGHFRDATSLLKMPDVVSQEFGASVADYDLDGDLDIFLPRYPKEEPDLDGISPGVPSILLENRGSLGFVDVSELLPAETNDGYPFVGGWHDLDLDGRPDLVLANDHGQEIRSNRVWQNTPEGFLDVSEEWELDVGIDAMGMAVGDANRDGHPDLAWTGWPELELLESAEPGWVRTSDARQLLPDHEDRQVGWGLDWGDLNNDGRLDLMVAYSHWENYPEEGAPHVAPNPLAQPDALFIQNASGDYEESAAAWGVDSQGLSRSFVLADFNEDGSLDLVLNEVWGPTLLKTSECSCAGWVEIELEMPGLNSKAIGATVQVTTAQGTQTAWVHAGGTNIAAGGPPRVHFGLGDIDTVERLEVTWPEGDTTCFRDVPGNQRLTISRSD